MDLGFWANAAQVAGFSLVSVGLIVWAAFKFFLEGFVKKIVEPLIEKAKEEQIARCKEHKEDAKEDIREMKSDIKEIKESMLDILKEIVKSR